jgi:RNA polymerase sigma factor (sigma-70 family)
VSNDVALISLIEQRVRCRFALTARELATRVREIAADACKGSERTIEQQAALLSLDDLYLATACLRNEQPAWREFSEAHFGFMRDFARRFLPPAAAREVADEIIAELWTRGRLAHYEGRSTLRTWLGAVVAHAALNSRKVMNRFVALDADQARVRASQPDPARAHEPANEQIEALLREFFAEALRALPAEDRLSLQLYYEQGLTLEELSGLLHASTAAVSRRLKRIREQLRAAIESLSRRRTGESAQELRAGLDLSRVELDLAQLFGVERQATQDGRTVV